MSYTRIIFAVWAIVGTMLPSGAQPMVTKYLYEFDTLGSGHPNDSINDQPAFLNAAAFFQARGGYGTLILEDGEYIVGKQQLHWDGDPLPGLDWTNDHYPSGGVAIQCPALVAIQPGFRLEGCSQFTLQGGANTTVRYRDCLYYGTFLRTPGTDEVFSAAGVDNCHSCLDTLHLPGLLHANVGVMFSFFHCDSITVRDVELNGNIDAALLGGRSADDGIQTEYDGLLLYESSNCVIENVDAHHFGRDGLLLWGTHTDTTDHFTDMYPGLYVGTDSADHSVTTPGNWTVLFNNQVHNSSFTWNGRQGFSWTALAGLQVTDCDFNYNGAGRMTSQPGAGLDIEGAGGPIRVRHGTFDDCRFLHNRASGIVSAHAVCMGQRNFKFTRCLVKAGLEGAAIWPEAAQMVFDSCEVYGNVGELYEQPEDIARDTAFNLVFRNTNFYEEDDQWSYIKWFFEGHPQDCQYGPQMFRFVKPGSALASFEHCGFHTNCKAIVRFKGRSINETGLQHCPIDSSGPCLSCTSPDDRYVRITDCVFVNTGREHCPAFGNPAGTEVLSADFATVDGLDIFIPATVRGGGVNDDYWTPMGAVTPDSMYVDTTTTYTTGAFPPCLPFYAHDTVAHWDMCDPANNVLVQACFSDANCYSDRAISSGIHSSTLGVGLSMTTVYIQGEFIIDNTFVIDQCTVRMGPGAEIIVTGGHVLEVVDSDLSACLTMWRSITVQDSAVANIFNSTIADAQYGVKSLDGSIVNAYNSSFQRNYVGIGVPDNGMGWNNTVVNVHGTTFSTSGPLAPPYFGQTPALGTKGFAGIEVHDMTLLIYGWNTFTDLSNGIVADGCDLSVTECTFADIQPDAAYAHPANGSGIRAKGQYGWFALKQAGHGQSGTPSFTNCRWGIYTEYMNVYSEQNNMVNVGTAYRVDRSGYRDVDILNNTLDTRYDGIDLRFNDGAAHLLVENNEITFATSPPPGQPTKGYVAIRVEEGNTLNPSSAIRNNTIHYRTGSATAHTGIRLTACNAYVVAGNELLMTDNATNFNGIFLRGCERCEVSCNNVLGALNGYPDPGQSAIRNTMGADPLISCNTVDRTSNGILFSGWAYGTDVRGNNLHNHKWPLHLDYSAIIEEQELRGNLWHSPVPIGGIGAWYENAALAFSYPFLYYPDTISGGNTQPPSVQPSTWFLPDGGANYLCDDDGTSYCSQFYAVRCTECPRPIDEKIAEDSLLNGNYTEETQWIMTGDLYKKLDESPDLLGSDPLLADFYAEQQGTLIAQFKELDDAQWQLFNLDSLILATLQQNQQQIADLMDLVKDAIEQLADSTLTTAQRQLLLSTIGGHQQTIGNLTTYNASALQLVADSRVLAADNVKATNAALGTSELIESNQQQVNDIFLGTVAKDVGAFTAAQATQLFDIANQCPMLGGNAVFRARALYSLIDDTQDFNDPLICLQQGIIVKSVEASKVHVVAIVPNPATDEAILVLEQEWDTPGVFIIHNALGAEALHLVVPAHTVRYSFSTASLAPAVYHFQVRAPSGTVCHGKMSIVR